MNPASAGFIVFERMGWRERCLGKIPSYPSIGGQWSCVSQWTEVGMWREVLVVGFLLVTGCGVCLFSPLSGPYFMAQNPSQMEGIGAIPSNT
ncbi:MAG: hypothetical protein RLZZ165_2036 [Bacteroidota bacterium]